MAELVIALFVLALAALPQDGPQVEGVEGVAPTARDPRIERHPVLGGLELEPVDLWPPARIWVQPPSEPQRGWQIGTAGTLGPWLAGLSAAFEEQVAKPAGLVADQERPAPTVVILRDKETFDRCSRRQPDARPTHPWLGGARFDAASGLVITHREHIVQTNMAVGRAAALHMAVHQLLHCHSKQGTEVAWVEEGLADALAPIGMVAEEAWGRSVPNGYAAIRLVELLDDARRRGLYVFQLEQLASFASIDAAVQAAHVRGQTLAAPVDDRLALEAFLFQAELWCWWSMHAAPDRWRQAYHELVAALQDGASTEDALRSSLGTFDLPEVTGQFERWVRELAAAAARPREQRLSPGAREPSGPTAAPELFPLSDLELGRNEAEEWIGRALARAMRGDLDSALAELGELEDDMLSPELAEHRRREHGRLQGLRELRELVLAEHLAAGKPLRLELDGRRHLLTLARVEAERVLLIPDPGEPEALDKRAIPIDAIVEQASPEALQAVGTWSRAWPECYRGDSRWRRRLVNVVSEAELELKEDAEGWYPRVRPAGETALALERLRMLAELDTPAIAQEFVNVLSTQWQESSAQPCLATRAKALRSFARRAYEVLAQGLSPVRHLNGLVTELGDDRLRVHYDFETAGQERDFRPDDAYMAAFRAANAALIGAKHDDALHVSKGSLRGSGRALVRHVLEFEAPMNVTWKLRVRGGETGDEGKITWYLGICGSEAERAIQASIFGWLYLILPSGGTELHKSEESPMVWHTHEYAFSLEHDGETLRLVRDGKEPAVGQAQGMTKGRLYVLLHSDHEVWLTELTIEGRVGADAVERRRNAWIEEQIEALGME